MSSDRGTGCAQRSQCWVRGTGRISGCPTEASSGEASLPDLEWINLAPLDPAALADDPQPFREQMAAVPTRRSRTGQQLNPSGAPLSTDAIRPGPGGTGDRSLKKPPPRPARAAAPTESPVDPSGKKKAPRPTAPPPDATAPTEVPVDPKKK
jgi:hypothetical protein